MKLYGSTTSPFVRKARVVVAEKELACRFIQDNPRLSGSHAQRLNPLGKAPVLELDDGSALYDSPVIVEYLDSLGGRRLLPADGPRRWSVLRLEALADGLVESAIRVWVESRRHAGDQHDDVMAWESRRIDRVLEALDKEPKAGPYFTSEITIADLSVGVAIEYIDHRLRLDWRSRLPRLASWLEPISGRPSFLGTALAEVA